MPFTPCERVRIKKKEEKKKKMRVAGRICDALTKTRLSASHLQNFIHVILEITMDRIFQHSFCATKKKEEAYESNFRRKQERLQYFIEYKMYIYFSYYLKRKEE